MLVICKDPPVSPLSALSLAEDPPLLPVWIFRILINAKNAGGSEVWDHSTTVGSQAAFIYSMGQHLRDLATRGKDDIHIYRWGGNPQGFRLKAGLCSIPPRKTQTEWPTTPPLSQDRPTAPWPTGLSSSSSMSTCLNERLLWHSSPCSRWRRSSSSFIFLCCVRDRGISSLSSSAESVSWT